MTDASGCHTCGQTRWVRQAGDRHAAARTDLHGCAAPVGGDEADGDGSAQRVVDVAAREPADRGEGVPALPGVAPGAAKGLGGGGLPVLAAGLAVAAGAAARPAGAAGDVVVELGEGLRAVGLAALGVAAVGVLPDR